jgi:hypothetical protein
LYIYKRNPRAFPWAKLVQKSSDKSLYVVESILDHYMKNVKYAHSDFFGKLYDEHDRRIVDIASPRNKLAIERRLWLHQRYEIREGRPEHVSATGYINIYYYIIYYYILYCIYYIILYIRYIIIIYIII